MFAGIQNFIEAKRFMYLVILISLVLVLSACGKTAKESQDGKTDGKFSIGEVKNPNITVMHHGAQEEPANTYAIETFEKKYGGKVTYVLIAPNEIQTKLVAALNSGDSPDATVWSLQNMPILAVKEVIQPVDNYFDFTSDIWSKRAMEQKKYKGKYYGVSADSNLWVIHYNKTLFEENGVKTPLEYFKEGNWNFNTFLDVAGKLTLDLDRDGTNDIYGYAVQNEHYFFIPNGANLVKVQDNGNFELNLQDNKVAEVLQFIQDGMYKYKYFTAPGGQARDNFIAGKVAMYTAQITVLENFADMKYERDFVPYPTGPSGEYGVTPAGSGFWGIPTGAKNPQGAAAWITMRCQYSYEHRNDRIAPYISDEQIKRVDEYRKNAVLPLYQGIGNFIQIMNQQLLNPVKKGQDIISTIESVIPLLQQEVDVVNN